MSEGATALLCKYQPEVMCTLNDNALVKINFLSCLLEHQFIAYNWSITRRGKHFHFILIQKLSFQFPSAGDFFIGTEGEISTIC